MKNRNVIFKILLPPLLCILCLSYINDSDFYPLEFGLIIAIFNYNHFNFKPYVGVIVSVLVSYVVYLLAALSFVGMWYLNQSMISYNTMNEGLIAKVITIISVCFIAPLLLFYLYGFIFKISKSKNSKWVIIISIVTLIFLQINDFNKEANFSSIKEYDYFNLSVYWQFVMALAIQLNIYQNNFFKKKLYSS
ncbi:MAG TPA: hypothetical protein EYO76_10545 [Flavobacteriaceae bacterium]|nr:hypothetical protein [Flavobacteriaceae bacterium]